MRSESGIGFSSGFLLVYCYVYFITNSFLLKSILQPLCWDMLRLNICCFCLQLYSSKVQEATLLFIRHWCFTDTPQETGREWMNPDLAWTAIYSLLLFLLCFWDNWLCTWCSHAPSPPLTHSACVASWTVSTAYTTHTHHTHTMHTPGSHPSPLAVSDKRWAHWSHAY